MPEITNVFPIRNALLSVSDKSGLLDLAASLRKFGVKCYSTGGTGDYLEKECGLSVSRVEDLTQFPEMMDGRVKTLHPKVFGGVLYRRDNSDDEAQAAKHGIPRFDLVVVNLYPFWEHLGEEAEKQAKFIDIGGPSLLRAASKNSAAVTVLSSSSDYLAFIEEMEKNAGATTLDFRRSMAGKTFQRTAEYDAMIASEWNKSADIPNSLVLANRETLRYGENPHQKALWVRPAKKDWNVLQGKELSYNNLLDTDAACRLVGEFSSPAIAIIKHNNPCGAAVGNDPYTKLFQKAFEADSSSAFGGIVACNREVDDATAEAMSPIFFEVILAPSFSKGALDTFGKKKNLRLIEWKHPHFSSFEIRSAMGGWLAQDRDALKLPSSAAAWDLVTKTSLPEENDADCLFSWAVCKHVRSNAIVIAKDGVTLGIGAGQMSRVDAVKIALQKCAARSTRGAVLASDAFFPFRDNIDLLKSSGIAAIVQPGGSIRDAEVIDACNELGIAMLFTKARHFRH